MRKCRFCEKEIQDASTVCEHCGRDLFPGRVSTPTPPESPAPVASTWTTDPIPRPVTGGGYILRKLIWSLSLIAMLIFAADGSFMFQMATTAPQQGAAAGAACFHMITIYVISRAIDELTRERPRF